MCVSNEPGYYHEGEFGIRLENIVMLSQHPKYENQLYFENLDYAPYERALIDLETLPAKMRKYVDDFHAKGWEKLSPFMQGEENAAALAYLKEKTQPL
jgi:Xaa-Pro aminopeptidase